MLFALLQVYGQCWDRLAEEFTLYRPLLSAIKSEYRLRAICCVCVSLCLCACVPVSLSLCLSLFLSLCARARVCSMCILRSRYERFIVHYDAEIARLQPTVEQIDEREVCVWVRARARVGVCARVCVRARLHARLRACTVFLPVIFSSIAQTCFQSFCNT